MSVMINAKAVFYISTHMSLIISGRFRAPGALGLAGRTDIY